MLVHLFDFSTSLTSSLQERKRTHATLPDASDDRCQDRQGPGEPPHREGGPHGSPQLQSPVHSARGKVQALGFAMKSEVI